MRQNASVLQERIANSNESVMARLEAISLVTDEANRSWIGVFVIAMCSFITLTQWLIRLDKALVKIDGGLIV
jgi:hypothetical protein